MQTVSASIIGLSLLSTATASHPGVLVDKFFTTDCLDWTPDRRDCHDVINARYTPYHHITVEEQPTRVPDLVKLPKEYGALVLDLKRPAQVSFCFQKHYHKEENDLCDPELGLGPEFCGREAEWFVRPDVPFAVPRGNGRYRGDRKGLFRGCGLTVSKDFPAGYAVIPQPAPFSRMLALEERDGSITPLPTVADLPAGQREVPVPGDLCPPWVQESMTITDYRDKRQYMTWHPQWHPVYACSMGHEHGSDPAVLGPVVYPDGITRDSLQVSLGFVAYYNDRQNEPDIGFKGYALQHDENVALYLVAHTTSSAQSRVCARFHTVMAYGVSKRTGELLFELGYKADFGTARARQSDAVLEPSQCPNQGEAKGCCRKSECFKRKLRILADEDKGYEKWTGADNAVNTDTSPLNDESVNTGMPLPLELNRLGFDIRNPITGCVDYSCEEMYYTGSDGTKRTLNFDSIRVQYEAEYDDDRDGYFVTDKYGFFLRDINLRACQNGQTGGGLSEIKTDRPGANGCELANGEMLQYVKPDFRAEITNGGHKHFASDFPWTAEYFPKDEDTSPRGMAIMDALDLGAGGYKDCRCADGSLECTCFRN